ncbi:MAG: hypothetical protein KAI71_06215 [Candidatus Pacebacteria bacterium]|nr:hypothetical protein [Candidatus Paceibacterota bacterium]
MKTNDQIQKEFSELERELIKARSDVCKLLDKSSFSKKILYDIALKGYNKALQRLEEFLEKSDKTICFRESTYSVICGECGQKIGISCEKPPEMYKCNFCGETTQIEYQIEKSANY